MAQSRRMRIPGPLAFWIPLVSVVFAGGCAGGTDDEVPQGVVSIADVGLLSPRAVIHDPVADVYLVSNMNGGPLDLDENGFISRLSPDGEVLGLTWAAPASGPTALHAPKGLAIRGDSVFVADVDCVGIFHRESGEADGRFCMDGVTSLSGLDVGPEGSLFATDSGFELSGGQLASSGTAAVYRLVLSEERRGGTLAQGDGLGHPLGIDVGSRGIFVVTTDPGQVLRLTPQGERTTVLTVTAGRFEGVVFLADGGFAYTSASDSTIYRVDGQGALHTALDGVGAPGDLGFDATRNRLLVPLTDENRVLLIDLE